MTKLPLPIGLLGGTFDPIHHGHLRAALEVQQALHLESVRLLPCHQPPHRTSPEASAEHRLNMVKSAVTGCPQLIVDDREIKRDEPSYTVTTLRDLRKELGDKQPFCLILGHGVFAGLPQWHEPHALLSLAHIIVIDRPEKILMTDELAPFLTHLTTQISDIRQNPHGFVYFQPISQLEISATHIRQLLKNHQSPQFLLPDSVLAYIMAHKLYQHTQ